MHFNPNKNMRAFFGESKNTPGIGSESMCLMKLDFEYKLWIICNIYMHL